MNLAELAFRGAQVPMAQCAGWRPACRHLADFSGIGSLPTAQCVRKVCSENCIRSVLTSFYTCTYHTSLEQQPARRLEAASAPIQRAQHTHARTTRHTSDPIGCRSATTCQKHVRTSVLHLHGRLACAGHSPQLLRPPHAHLHVQPARQPLHAASHLDDAPDAHRPWSGGALGDARLERGELVGDGLQGRERGAVGSGMDV